MSFLSPDPPAQQANQFAQRAEDFATNRQYRQAIDAHYRAAELYLLAMNDTTEQHTVKTLKLLYANHTRLAKELVRRIPAEQPFSSKSPNSPNSNKNNEASQVNKDEARNSNSKRDNDDVILKSDERINIDHSFLILDKQGKAATQNVEQDPFERFWEQVEGLVINGAPAGAAFTAQLFQSQYPSASVDLRHAMASQMNSNEPAGQQSHMQQSQMYRSDNSKQSQIYRSQYNMQQSKYLNLQYSYIQSPQTRNQPYQYENSMPSSKTPLTRNDQSQSTMPNLLQSYLIVDSTSHPKTLEEYELENKHMKSAIDMLSLEVAKLERTASDHQLLQSSVLQFRQQVQRQDIKSRDYSPRQNMASSNESIKIAHLEKQVSQLSREKQELKVQLQGAPSSNESRLECQVSQLNQHVIELNEEVDKYKMRWEKLKQSAKRKKEIKLGLGNESSGGTKPTSLGLLVHEDGSNTNAGLLKTTSETNANSQEFEPRDDELSMYFSAYSKNNIFDAE